jgi:signal transduction histidine kinase
MSSSGLYKLRNAAPFLVAIAALILIAVTGLLRISVGYHGIEWNPLSGEVLNVQAESPGAGRVRPGDLILRIEGVPAEQAPPELARHGPGDILTFDILRGRSEAEVSVRLSNVPFTAAIPFLVPHLVALAFWSIGVAVMAFARRGGQARLLLSFTLVGSSALASGSVSAVGPAWTSTVFNVLLWFAGPIAVQLHMRFPEARLARWNARLTGILFAIAALGSLPFVVAGASGVRASAWNQVIFTAGRLFLSVNLLLVVWLLLDSYRTASSVHFRQQIRLVALGGGLGLLLVIALSLLPGALIVQPLVPYEYSFIFLITIPLSYGYAIARHRLIRLEKFLSRGAAYTIMFGLLAMIYLAVISLIESILPGELLREPLFTMSLILLLAGTAVQLFRRIQAVVDFAFYGGWYDYRSAVERITSGLETMRDAAMLATTLEDRLQGTLRLERALVLIAGRDGSLRADGKRGSNGVDIPLRLPANGHVLQYLRLSRDPLEAVSLAHALQDLPLTRSERKALESMQDCFLVPVSGSQAVLGLLALGQRRGGERFSAEDLDILMLVSRQAASAIDAVLLRRELRRQVEEVQQLNKRLLHAREEERKSLARQLHDVAIQSLVGLNYRLAHLENGQTEALRDEVRAIVEQLRGVIRQLRPPALDSFGLVTAVRSEMRERAARGDGSPRLDLHLAGDPEMPVPEAVGLCVYRVMQEALTNVERHAAAAQASVQLVLQPDEVQLIVQDNGRGFEVPPQLGLLLEDDHFGLVGLRERIELLYGTLEIRSASGQGTTVHARIPVPHASDDQAAMSDNLP